MPVESTPRAAPRRILEDASGRRLRRLRWLGRVIALFFVVWLAAVILGGLGVGPALHVPFGRVLRPSSGPPPLRHVPHVTPPAAADLVPALPAPPALAVQPTRVRGKSTSAPGRTKTTTTTTTTHGRSAASPGHTKTTTTTTTTVRSLPPGRTKLHGRKP